jgi:hypothetical protein
MIYGNQAAKGICLDVSEKKGVLAQKHQHPLE